MPKTLKYIGTQDRWPELAATGKQAMWFKGQQDDRSDADAAALLATGLFDNLSDDVLTSAQMAALQARNPVLDGASAGAATGWLPMLAGPERFVYQLDSGSTSTQFAVDISADGVTSLGQAFTGVWARSDLAYITGLISFSNPLAKFMKFTVVSGGPISIARGA